MYVYYTILYVFFYNSNYNIYTIFSYNSSSVCYTAEAYTTSWVSSVSTIYYYTQSYSYSCGWLWLSTCYGSSYK